MCGPAYVVPFTRSCQCPTAYGSVNSDVLYLTHTKPLRRSRWKTAPWSPIPSELSLSSSGHGSVNLDALYCTMVGCVHEVTALVGVSHPTMLGSQSRHRHDSCQMSTGRLKSSGKEPQPHARQAASDTATSQGGQRRCRVARNRQTCLCVTRTKRARQVAPRATTMAGDPHTRVHTGTHHTLACVQHSSKQGQHRAGWGHMWGCMLCNKLQHVWLAGAAHVAHAPGCNKEVMTLQPGPTVAAHPLMPAYEPSI